MPGAGLRRERALRVPRWKGRKKVVALGLMTAAAAGGAVAPTALSQPAGAGFTISTQDLQFLLHQVKIGEQHAAREDAACAPGNLTVAACADPSTSPIGVGPNDVTSPLIQNGIRQVDGRNNNISQGYSPWNGRGYDATVGVSAWGGADMPFPVATGLVWRDATLFNGPGTAPYSNRGVDLVDDQAREASNLIVDQTAGNAAAAAAAGPNPTVGSDQSVLIPNTAPAGGVAPPFNGLFTLFGQFFDHGLDLVGKDAVRRVRVNLKPDDPLCNGQPNCTLTMALSRTSLDGQLRAKNTTTPWIDQNQTYTSHPSHHVFLREYECQGNAALQQCTPANPPVATGRLADSTDPQRPGTQANWTEVKQQAQQKLGIALDDYDVNDVPLLLTDEYGRFLRGPNGFPLVVMANGTTAEEGSPANPVRTVTLANVQSPQDRVTRIGHAFIDDMSFNAGPQYVCNGTTCTNQGNSAALGRHFIMGDGRGNENIGLTAIHHVFHSEHNRVADDLKAVITASGDPALIAEWRIGGVNGPWNGERLMQAARLVTEMQYQHLVFEEFARLVEPGIAPATQYNPSLRPDITAEFAHAVYRFGHSMLNPTVERRTAGGADASLPLLGAFTNPVAFNAVGGGTVSGPQAAGAVARGMVGQRGNEIDEFVTNTLRNSLLGQPLDLATLNILRGRDTGTQPLNGARRALFQQNNGDPSLAPYGSWSQFGLALRHPQSLVNFVAAYGKHPSITGTLAAKRIAAEALVNGSGGNPPADRVDFMNGTGAWADQGGVPSTGLEDIDLWVGGLAERPVNNLAGSMLGSTFAFVFRTQLENLQDSDRFYYLQRLAGTNLVNQVEGNTFAEMVIRNTDASNIPANAFIQPTKVFDLNGPAPADITVGPTGRWTYPGTEDAVWVGSPGSDDMLGGSGSDTMRGNDGNDRVEGSLGDDTVVGGLGNDILSDTGGANTLTGGDGNDYLSGAGSDALLAGSGHDFVVGFGLPTGTIGGLGNDLVFTGNSDDTATGDDHHDWIDGGPGLDVLIGDSEPPFAVDLNAAGNDVINGGPGGDTITGDGGVDISTSTTSDEGDAIAGGFGFDFHSYADATAPVDGDLGLGAPPAGVPVTPDTFLDVEGISGGSGNDTLAGDDRTSLLSPTPGATDELGATEAAGAFRGLDALVGLGQGWTGGNIIMGGPGSDTLRGRGGNDLVDGDAALEVRISVPITPVTASCPGITGTVVTDPQSGGQRVLVSQVLQLRQATLAGCLDPGSASFTRTVVTGPAPVVGTDIAAFAGDRADYTVTDSGGRLIVTDTRPNSPDGTDTLRGIETLRFADGDVPASAAASGPGALAGPAVAPATLLAGATGKVAISMTTVGVVPANGKVTITFPGGFDLSGIGAQVTFGSSATDFDGSASVSVNGQVVTITRGGAATPSGPGPKTITLSGIVNPATAGTTGAFDIATTNAQGSVIDQGQAAGVTISDPPPPAPVAPAPGVAAPTGAPAAAAPAPVQAPTAPGIVAARPATAAPLSLARSRALRNGRTVRLVVVARPATSAAPWRAVLSAGSLRRVVTGRVPSNASAQVKSVRLSPAWDGRRITVVITPLGGGTGARIVLR